MNNVITVFQPTKQRKPQLQTPFCWSQGLLSPHPTGNGKEPSVSTANTNPICGGMLSVSSFLGNPER